MRRTITTAQGLARGALWLGQSPAIAATLALPVLAHPRLPAAAVTIGAIAAYYLVPAALLSSYKWEEGHQVQFGPREAFGGIAAALLSSVGPWWCLANAVHSRWTGATYTHDKTER